MKAFLGLALILALPVTKKDLPDELHINRIQVIGSHNSYKKAIDPALFKMFQQKDSAAASTLDYEHISFSAQLDMGLRNMEIDVYADEKGGRWAHPKGLDWVPNQAPYDAEGMNEPGFKIFHVPDLDFRSQAPTLKKGLQELKAWSEKHPDHSPVFITLEVKGGGENNAKLTPAEEVTAKTFDELDNDIRQYLGESHLITPDMVRGNYNTLEEAVTHDNWPTLKAAKGKFLFILDDHAKKRDMYIAGHPSLKGRVLFANAEAGTPEAAAMIRNNPKDPQIKDLVAKGYIIRTRADSDTRQARVNDRSSFEAACASGAQIITTDYYLKSTHFKSDYVVSFEGSAKYIRVNPVSGSNATAGDK